MEKIKVAVIGCGTIANSAHIPAYMKCEEAEIKYFCDIIPERATAAVEKYGCGIAITDYHEALNDPEITAISVCTPNYAHKEISVAALAAGKNVLCEKPAARTLAEAEEMLAAQQKYGKILNIGVVNRFNDNVREIKKIIDSGTLGEIYHVYVSFRAHRSIPGLGGAFTTKAVAGGGVLIDWGVHYLDIVMYCCGDPTPKTVSAETFAKLGNPMENYVYESMWAGPPKLDGTCDVDEAIAGIIRTDGPIITINGSWAQNVYENDGRYIDFMGSKAGIRLWYGGKFKVYGVSDGKLTTEEIDVVKSNMFENEINAFVRDSVTQEKLPSHIEVNIKTQRIMEALYASAESHKEVTL